MKNAGKACNNRLYRHIRTFEKIVKNYFVILYTYKKYSIDDFAKRFGVSRRTINYDIVYLMDFYEIDTKPGPHGGISLIDRRPNSHTAYLKPIEIEWLRRKYNEAETEEDRMAAHSILRRFSL